MEIKNSKELSNRKGWVLLKLFTTWCGPCKLLKPEFEAASKLVTNIEFLEANVEIAIDIKEKFGIQSIPVIILLKDGEEIDRFSGFRPKNTIVDFINKHIN